MNASYFTQNLEEWNKYVPFVLSDLIDELKKRKRNKDEFVISNYFEKKKSSKLTEHSLQLKNELNKGPVRNWKIYKTIDIFSCFKFYLDTISKRKPIFQYFDTYYDKICNNNSINLDLSIDELKSTILGLYPSVKWSIFVIMKYLKEIQTELNSIDVLYEYFRKNLFGHISSHSRQLRKNHKIFFSFFLSNLYEIYEANKSKNILHGQKREKFFNNQTKHAKLEDLGQIIKFSNKSVELRGKSSVIKSKRLDIPHKKEAFPKIKVSMNISIIPKTNIADTNDSFSDKKKYDFDENIDQFDYSPISINYESKNPIFNFDNLNKINFVQLEMTENETSSIQKTDERESASSSDASFLELKRILDLPKISFLPEFTKLTSGKENYENLSHLFDDEENDNYFQQSSFVISSLPSNNKNVVSSKAENSEQYDIDQSSDSFESSSSKTSSSGYNSS
ncbi:hypothetical protein TRFO_21328 [Tritrichomonas foetus]|uniref:Uncharacterized protein n=1 Tax=Tritrichomonas foetus TaxID=1144522 RepID=A0A1J4KE51_9EUKA|nr:hypothetical protein TRFO_21328 [Tritrichomonas foetus]|eukprot:OHT09705.1 hypothetical protein TRFO_21328 [Tritrichomonas foetus]